MSNTALSITGIIIMLGGVVINFSLLASMKIMDFGYGVGFLAIPIILGGGMLIGGVWYKDQEEIMTAQSRSPLNGL